MLCRRGPVDASRRLQRILISILMGTVFLIGCYGPQSEKVTSPEDGRLVVEILPAEMVKVDIEGYETPVHLEGTPARVLEELRLLQLPNLLDLVGHFDIHRMNVLFPVREAIVADDVQFSILLTVFRFFLDKNFSWIQIVSCPGSTSKFYFVAPTYVMSRVPMMFGMTVHGASADASPRLALSIPMDPDPWRGIRFENNAGHLIGELELAVPDREFGSLEEALESVTPDWTDTICMMRWKEDTTFGTYCRFLQTLTTIGCRYFLVAGKADERNRWGPDAPETIYVLDATGL